MNTAAVNDPVNRRNRSRPALEMALTMLTRKRLPVRLMTGVWPTGSLLVAAAGLGLAHVPALAPAAYT